MKIEIGNATNHTPGPWQIVETELPHHHGGRHIERRIFTAWDHPQMRGPIGVVNRSIGIGAAKGGPGHSFVSIDEADARLIAAAPELLEAIKKVLPALIAKSAMMTAADWAAVEAANAAVAKATGSAA